MPAGTVLEARRQPAVAGLLYAGTERLREQVRLLVPPRVRRQPVIGAVAPHGGFLYSGQVAAAVYARIEPPATLVIVGPNHTNLGAQAAIMTEGAWTTPLGDVNIDRDLACAILEASKTLEEDPLAHRGEHSIEVQLPFLQVLMPETRFVPICLMGLDPTLCWEVGNAVAEGVWRTHRPAVIVATADMSQHVRREEAEWKDRKAIAAMEALDPAGLLAAVRREGISMCGVHAAVAGVVAAKVLGAARGVLVGYATSGDATMNYEHVVGYAGLLMV